MSNEPGAIPEMAGRIARMVRHEVGDLLQSVYSTAAVLLSRLPADLELERQMVSDLRRRAEMVRSEMDAVVHLVTAVPPRLSLLDLNAHVQAALAQMRRHQPAVPVSFETVGPCPVQADPGLLGEGLFLLLCGLGQGARGLWVRLGRSDCVECQFQRDGYPPTPEQLAWLNEPFATTQQSLLGLALAVCSRAAGTAAGAIEASPHEQGVLVRLIFPTAAES